MSEDQIPKKILDVLRKLMNLQEGAEKVGSIHEAENAAARINEILLKYNLEMSELKFSEESKIISEEMPLPGVVMEDGQLKNKRKNEGNWLSLLYIVISRHNLCKVVFAARNGFTFGAKFFGKKVNIEVVKYQLSYLEPTLLRLAKDSWKQHSQFNYTDTKNTYIRSFLQGCVYGIEKKLKDEKNKFEAENNNITSLVRREDIEIDAVIKASITKPLKESKLSVSSSNNGLQKGFKAGQSIALNKGLEQSRSNMKSING